MLVLLGHCCSYYATPDWFGRLEIGAVNGEASVVIFFVLSGYVLARMLEGAALGASGVLSYLSRRLFRIYPALWVASLLALVYVVYFHAQIPVPGTSDWFQDRFKVSHYNALGIAASFAGLLAFLIPPVWSICVELVGSVGIVALRLVSNRRPVFIGVGLALLLISYTIGPYTYYSVGTFMLEFWIGYALFLTVMGGARALDLPRFAQMLATVLAVVFVVGGQYFGQGGTNPTVTLAYAVAAVVFIVGSVKQWRGFGFLKRRSLVALGDWSYSLYLLHFTVMCGVAKAMQLLGASALDSVTRSLLLCVLTTVITIPLSALAYRYVELPGIALGNRVSAAMGLRRSPVTAGA